MTDTIFERNDTLYSLDPEHTRVAKELGAQGVKYAMANWIDVLGRPKSKVVPMTHFADLVAGAERYTPRGFGGIGNMNPTEDEVVGVPDLSTLKILPWDRRYAWMIADMSYGGREPFALCPRNALRTQVEAAAAQGYSVHLGVEPEFYVFRPESLEGDRDRLVPVARSGSLKPSPAYDVEATLDASEFLDTLVGYLSELDFGVYAFGHEGGDGQYELSIGHAPVLEMADRMTLFRFAVKQIAKECGLLASFMPKPFTEHSGSSAHLHISLWRDGAPAFASTDGSENALALNAIGGLLEHLPSITLFGAHSVNAYRRFTPDSFAPATVTWSRDNRSAAVRSLVESDPAATRIELRSGASDANPYWLIAAALAAVIAGIRADRTPPAAEGGNLYGKGTPLPESLGVAIALATQDDTITDILGTDSVHDFAAIARSEWQTYTQHVSDWELRRYLATS